MIQPSSESSHGSAWYADQDENLRMKIVPANLLLGIGLVLIPVIAELATAHLGQRSGAGLSVLLYWPVHYAFLVLAFFLFTALNARIFSASGRPVLWGVMTGVIFSGLWFLLAFLVVAQLHLMRGGAL